MWLIGRAARVVYRDHQLIRLSSGDTIEQLCRRQTDAEIDFNTRAATKDVILSGTKCVSCSHGRCVSDAEVAGDPATVQSRWTEAKFIASVSRSVPASPELCAYHRYVVSRRIQQQHQQLTTAAPAAVPARRSSVDLLASPGITEFPQLDALGRPRCCCCNRRPLHLNYFRRRYQLNQQTARDFRFTRDLCASSCQRHAGLKSI